MISLFSICIRLSCFILLWCGLFYVLFLVISFIFGICLTKLAQSFLGSFSSSLFSSLSFFTRGILIEPISQITEPPRVITFIWLSPTVLPLVDVEQSSAHVSLIQVLVEQFQSLRHLLAWRDHQPIVEVLIARQVHAWLSLYLSHTGQLLLNCVSLGRLGTHFWEEEQGGHEKAPEGKLQYVWFHRVQDRVCWIYGIGISIGCMSS